MESLIKIENKIKMIFTMTWEATHGLVKNFFGKCPFIGLPKDSTSSKSYKL
jgi:hypothetical protein